MFSTTDGIELETNMQLSGIHTDLIQAITAKPKYIIKTHANQVSVDDILAATKEQGYYMYTGVTKPAERLIVSRLQPNDHALLIHSAPPNMAGAHAIVEVSGQPEKYFDDKLRRQAHRVPLRYLRPLNRVIPLSVLIQTGRNLEIEIFNMKRRLMIDQVTEIQFNALLQLEADGKGTEQEATTPTDDTRNVNS